MSTQSCGIKGSVKSARTIPFSVCTAAATEDIYCSNADVILFLLVLGPAASGVGKPRTRSEIRLAKPQCLAHASF